MSSENPVRGSLVCCWLTDWLTDHLQANISLVQAVNSTSCSRFIFPSLRVMDVSHGAVTHSEPAPNTSPHTSHTSPHLPHLVKDSAPCLLSDQMPNTRAVWLPHCSICHWTRGRMSCHICLTLANWSFPFIFFLSFCCFWVAVITILRFIHLVATVCCKHITWGHEVNSLTFNLYFIS